MDRTIVSLIRNSNNLNSQDMKTVTLPQNSQCIGVQKVVVNLKGVQILPPSQTQETKIFEQNSYFSSFRFLSLFISIDIDMNKYLFNRYSYFSEKLRSTNIYHTKEQSK
jgi:hypothetical protein